MTEGRSSAPATRRDANRTAAVVVEKEKLMREIKKNAVILFRVTQNSPSSESHEHLRIGELSDGPVRGAGNDCEIGYPR